jgi:diguanylate cyclase (GGDEF)-like protein
MSKVVIFRGEKMAIKYGKMKHKRHNILYTGITAFLLCVVFLTMVSHLYISARNDAEENLHVQTKQIKDDIILQLISDRENLSTMANFAAKLYSDGERYDIMFDSFKPIGLIENIGILTPDNNFVTKAGFIDLNGKIAFDEEKQKGAYISGRVKDLTRDNYEIIKSAVPIVVKDETVGILYGVIKLDKIGERYNRMAKDLDAQLFVYDKENGNLVIDNIHDTLGNISFLKDRVYNEDYSYEQFMATDKGFTSFVSAYKDENVYMHYSTIEEIGWMIAMARYDSQVFAATEKLANILILVFFIMLVIIVLYIIALLTGEKQVNRITDCASNIRKTLLETSGNQDNIVDSLMQMCEFSGARSAVFFDTDGETFGYISPRFKEFVFTEKEKNHFKSELFRYAAELCQSVGSSVATMSIKPNSHLCKTNQEFYEFLKREKITCISFSATINNTNHITILAVINSKQEKQVKMLAEKTAACFSMALYNKNYLNKTKLVATTDSLTGALNRVAYKTDLMAFEKEIITDFSCIYVDVNELHLINNKFGHASGDQMLIYIANTLKEVFYGHKIYRMGGDEFLVFCKNVDQSVVEKSIEIFLDRLKTRDYHVAIGLSFRAQNSNTEEMVREAEVRMYEAKAEYYQNKENKQDNVLSGGEYFQVRTGINEIDTILSIMKENYTGIYRVSLDTDKARGILMPEYLNYNEHEEHFSKLFTKYVSESVEPDYHRAVMSFLNYEVIKHQLMEDKTPKITFKKNNGESVVLSVYKLVNGNDFISDTLWIFAKG